MICFDFTGVVNSELPLVMKYSQCLIFMAALLIKKHKKLIKNKSRTTGPVFYSAKNSTGFGFVEYCKC